MYKALSLASEKVLIGFPANYSEGKSEKNIGDLLPLFSKINFKYHKSSIRPK